MDGDSLFYAGAHGVEMKFVPDAGLSGKASHLVEEKVVRRGRLPELGPDLLDVFFEVTAGRCADRHNAVFLAFWNLDAPC